MLRNAPVTDEQHFRRIIFQLGQNVGRHQQGHAFVPQGAQQHRQAVARFRIKTGRRFVQQQHQRFVNDGLSDAETLTHPPRQGARCIIQPVRQVDPCTRSVNRLRHLTCRDAAGTGRKVQALPHRKVTVNAKEIRQVTDSAMHAPRLFHRIETVDLDPSCIRPVEGCQTAQQRGLARSIRPDQRRDGTAIQRDAHIAERANLRVLIADAVGNNHHGQSIIPAGAQPRSETLYSLPGR